MSKHGVFKKGAGRDAIEHNVRELKRRGYGTQDAQRLAREMAATVAKPKQGGISCDALQRKMPENAGLYDAAHKG